MTFFCLTPVKNEAWILDRFLRCASLWADHIIVADQGSTDESREIAARFPKVTLIDNARSEYDEESRQKLLLDAARRVPCQGVRALISLDADEVLSADLFAGAEWDQIRAARPGTVIDFQWANLLPGFDGAWVMPKTDPWGFIDDGSDHVGSVIHSHRLPQPPGAPRLLVRQGKVLHYQFAAWERMKSKQRWYQCWELLRFPRKGALRIYRQYHYMDAIPAAERRPVDPAWYAGYEVAGIEMRTVPAPETTWWDNQVAAMLIEHGPRRFRKLDIWDCDWTAIAKDLNLDVPSGGLADPRSEMDKAVLRWLGKTQGRSRSPGVRVCQGLLRSLGW